MTTPDRDGRPGGLREAVSALAEWLYGRSGGIFWRGETTWQDRHREEARQWFAYADMLALLAELSATPAEEVVQRLEDMAGSVNEAELRWRLGEWLTDLNRLTENATEDETHTPGWPCGGRVKCPACCAATPTEEPAEVAVEEREAQRRALVDWIIDNRWAFEAYDFSHALLASAWLRDHDAALTAKAKAAALREAADGYPAAYHWTEAQVVEWLRDRADRMTP